MIRRALIIVATVWSLGLVVLGLWGWQGAEAIANYLRLRQVPPSVWAVRCAAMAAVAAAQAILLLAVVGMIFRRGPLGTVLGLSAALLGMLSAASAVALGLAGR